VNGALTVGTGVIRDMVRLAALEVPGVLKVGRSGPVWRSLLGGRAISVRVRDARVQVKIWVVARPGHSLAALSADVRSAAGAAVERLLGLELGAVTVLVDGVGS
jgi:uncharacterized alkaline shock family protein YloU